jgi:hypothetical protein
VIYIAIDLSTIPYPPLRAKNEIVNPSIKSMCRGERMARCLTKYSSITQEIVQEMSDGTGGEVRRSKTKYSRTTCARTCPNTNIHNCLGGLSSIRSVFALRVKG